MFPFRHSSIFRSRWMALLWAGGIIWTAVDVAGSPDTGAGNQVSDTSVDADQMKQAEKLLDDLGR